METETLAASENAQPHELENLQRKTQFKGTVLKTTLAGAIVDIGLETPGVVHISQLRPEPTNRVEDVVQVGQGVEVWVRRVEPKKGRIDLTMIKPLDLEWRELNKGMVVKGKVTRLEKFGAFVDIGAERPGLVHISELTHDFIKSVEEVIHEGDEVEVQIIDVNRRKKQIKLSMKALEEKPVKPPKPERQPKEKEAAVPEEREEPVPTAMEIALREAMERSQSTRGGEDRGKGKRKPKGDDEMEDILARTLEHRGRSGK
jgi:predicted RNA-binding protein with RPS1 domain